MDALKFATACFKKATGLKTGITLHGAARDVMNAWAADVGSRIKDDRYFDTPFRFISWDVLEAFILWLNSTGILVDGFMQLAGDRGSTGYLTRLENDNANLQHVCRFYAGQFRDAENYPTLTAEIERIADVFQRDIEARLER